MTTNGTRQLVAGPTRPATICISTVGVNTHMNTCRHVRNNINVVSTPAVQVGRCDSLSNVRAAENHQGSQSVCRCKPTSHPHLPAPNAPSHSNLHYRAHRGASRHREQIPQQREHQREAAANGDACEHPHDEKLPQLCHLEGGSNAVAAAV